MKIALLSKYSRLGASSRYRTFQYLPHLEMAGIHCKISPLFDDEYLANRYRQGRGSIPDLLRAFQRRIMAITRARSADLVVIEYELIPYYPALFEKLLARTGCRYVVDYDDALFHQYDHHRNPLVRTLLGKKIATVMRHAELVLAGNSYLADYAGHAGAKRVEIIPTVVDLDRYPLKVRERQTHAPLVIGWIGSPSTAKYLQTIAPALAEVCRDGRALVRVIGSGAIDLPGVPVEVLPWNEATEVISMQTFDVGIMPLPDEPWARGKCGFKLIQYMACGLPVVASPVGVNAEIVEELGNGLLSASHDEWVKALCFMRDHPKERSRMGKAGRVKVETRYSLQVMAPRLVELLRRL
ncbi:MAG: glycosyltransferase family 4 protein [Wenzhouxiangella sp.]